MREIPPALEGWLAADEAAAEAEREAEVDVCWLAGAGGGNNDVAYSNRSCESCESVPLFAAMSDHRSAELTGQCGAAMVNTGNHDIKLAVLSGRDTS